MPTITYIEHDGTRHVVEVAIGSTLMQGARLNNIQGINADCGGACACSTCHAYLSVDWITRVAPYAELESDMLEFALDVDPIRSRLTCQITVTADLDGLILHMPKNQA